MQKRRGECAHRGISVWRGKAGRAGMLVSLCTHAVLFCLTQGLAADVCCAVLCSAVLQEYLDGVTVAKVKKQQVGSVPPADRPVLAGCSSVQLSVQSSHPRQVARAVQVMTELCKR